jgi:hypothetical protein
LTFSITKYLGCVDTRSRWTSWSCNKPSDYRDIEGRYSNLDKKGILLNDIQPEKIYKSEIKGLNSEVIYKNNAWLVEVI